MYECQCQWIHFSRHPLRIRIEKKQPNRLCFHAVGNSMKLKCFSEVFFGVCGEKSITHQISQPIVGYCNFETDDRNVSLFRYRKWFNDDKQPVWTGLCSEGEKTEKSLDWNFIVVWEKFVRRPQSILRFSVCDAFKMIRRIYTSEKKRVGCWVRPFTRKWIVVFLCGFIVFIFNSIAPTASIITGVGDSIYCKVFTFKFN